MKKRTNVTSKNPIIIDLINLFSRLKLRVGFFRFVVELLIHYKFCFCNTLICYVFIIVVFNCTILFVMQKKISIYVLYLLIGVFLWGGCLGREDDTAAQVVGLKCRGLVDPIGIDEPIFSWQIVSEEHGFIQSAWEIEIASSLKTLETGDCIWSSGRVESEQQQFIRPIISELEKSFKYWWRVRIWDANSKVTAWSKPASFVLGIRSEEWKGLWITSEWKENSSMPYFRKEFKVEDDGREVESAIVYFCGLGCGDLYLNGALVDQSRVLDPAQTNYDKYALYSSFDITSQLIRGYNCLGVLLGEGWYGQGQVWGENVMKYGNPLFRLQLELVYTDGTIERVVSDESWQWAPSALLKSNIYAGEVYDATKEKLGWSNVGFMADKWKQVVVATGTIPCELRPQLVEPIRLIKELRAIKKWKDPAGNWVFDFGVNVAGVPRIEVNLPKGTHLKMRMGEILNEDGSIDFSTTGVFATGVIQTDEYICAGDGVETWNPRFSYHGYRYLELSGLKSEPNLDCVKTIVVHSNVQQRGEFECSNKQINTLHELAIRTMLSNTHGLPTDCPHRERCGWLGDAHTVAPFESYNFDLNNFWNKYLQDVHSTSSNYEKKTLYQKLYNTAFYFAEKKSGIPYMISPGKRLCGVASPDWGTAVVQLPWFTYLFYGDDEPLRIYYDEMKQWVEHVEQLSMNDTLPRKHIVPYGLGDWCPPGGNETIDCPIALSSTAFHYFDVSIMEKVANLLKKTEDVYYFNSLKKSIYTAFVAEFYDMKNKTFGSQTADAMALDFGLVPKGDEGAVSKAIAKNMEEKYDNFLHIGIFGLGRIGEALSRYGNGKKAWELFTKTGENSFAYMWTDAEATTLWEVLPINKQSKEFCLQNRSSLNHPMQGGYDTWFYEDIAGIRVDESGAGFKVVRLEPTMASYLEWASASVYSGYGKTVSDWFWKNDQFIWKIELPANTSGLVALPNGRQVEINGIDFSKETFPLVEKREKSNLYCFLSGEYTIVIK